MVGGLVGGDASPASPPTTGRGWSPEQVTVGDALGALIDSLGLGVDHQAVERIAIAPAWFTRAEATIEIRFATTGAPTTRSWSVPL